MSFKSIFLFLNKSLIIKFNPKILQNFINKIIETLSVDEINKLKFLFDQLKRQILLWTFFFLFCASNRKIKSLFNNLFFVINNIFIFYIIKLIWKT